jgi:hypothetical protein
VLADEGPLDDAGVLLMKPVTSAELLGAVRSALETRPAPVAPAVGAAL